MNEVLGHATRHTPGRDRTGSRRGSGQRSWSHTAGRSCSASMVRGEKADGDANGRWWLVVEGLKVRGGVASLARTNRAS